MVTAGPSAADFGAQFSRRQRRRALIASTIGTSIEWYDFLLYGNATALYLAPLFFPQKNAVLSVLAAYGTFLIGFLVRPIGAAFFGNLGDRMGRKATLIVTLLVMGTATFLIGLVPTYAEIGVWGGLILFALRVLQGLGIGGEWGGSVLLTVEWGGRRGRGFLASFPQLGVPVGLLLGYGALQFFTLSLGQHSYWGWRVPFLLSIVLVGVGLYIRLGILETPVFARLLEERRIERTPVAQLVRHDWREVVLCFMVRAGETAPALIFQTFWLTYATLVLHVKQASVYNFVILAALVSLGAIPLFGHLSDRIGRKRMYLIGAAVMFLFAFPYWALLGTGMTVLMALAVVASFVVQDLQYAPQAALMAESFTGRRRYSGASLGYHLGAAIWSGTAPIIALSLLNTYHSAVPIALYMMATALVSLAACALLRDRSNADLGVEYDDLHPLPIPPEPVTGPIVRA
ncbi:MAG TPA: MFS transporter [Candidatus Dormibacteraeota bacterium]|nr:MFS transporter [Candidatus Dormibacteraeota bacterium]